MLSLGTEALETLMGLRREPVVTPLRHEKDGPRRLDGARLCVRGLWWVSDQSLLISSMTALRSTASRAISCTACDDSSMTCALSEEMR